MKSFHLFDTGEEAIQYRKEQGCGGYIFIPNTNPNPSLPDPSPNTPKPQAVLFPYGMTATPCLLHPLTKGLNGTLI